jgi:hypothetical protein
MKNLYGRLNGGIEADLAKLLNRFEFDLASSIYLFTRSENPVQEKICREIEEKLFDGHPIKLCDEYATAASFLEYESEITSFILGLKLGLSLAK